MSRSIEGHTRHQNRVTHKTTLGHTCRLHDMEGTFLQIVSTLIGIPHHRFVVDDFREKHRLTISHKVINQLVRAYLIRQGIIGTDDIRLRKPDLQAGYNRKRQLFQLLWRELSLDLSYLQSQVVLTHGLSKWL